MNLNTTQNMSLNLSTKTIQLNYLLLLKSHLFLISKQQKLMHYYH